VPGSGREARRVWHQDQGRSGEWAGPVHAWGVGLARPLSRGALPSPRRRRRAAVPATGRLVVARRYVPSGTAVAHSARVRLARPTAPGIVLPVKITVKTSDAL